MYACLCVPFVTRMRSLTHSSAGPVDLPPPGQVSYSYPSSYPVPVFPIRDSYIPITPHDSHPANRHREPFPFFHINDNSLLFSQQTRDHITRAMKGALSDATLRRYSGAVKQFILFCDQERIPERLRFPADEFVLCAFAASSLGKHAGSTPRARISALKAWHVAHNLEWKGSPRLRYVLSGVHNLAPNSSSRPPRPPINARMLSQLIDNLDLNSPLDAAVAACAATAFWGQCRLGELLPTLSLSPLPTVLPTRADFKRSVRNPQSCVLHLPRTKTHQNGQDVVLVDQHAPVNPVSLLKNHIRVSGVAADSYIFSYTSVIGPSFLSKDVFLRRCNAIWASLGYPHTTGHSFRIGGTTELLIAGIPPDVVKVMGRWSSDSFLRYWRSLDVLAPQYIRNLNTHKRYRLRR